MMLEKRPGMKCQIMKKSKHKIVIVLGEVKTLSPSSKLSGEKGSGVTKKAIYDMIGEARHWGVWLLSDYQSPEDLFSGVKSQADIFIIKRGTPKILGDDWGHLFDPKKSPILQKRDRIFYANGGINGLSMTIADKKWPIIQRLPDNQGYIHFDDENVRLVEFEGACWHHKHTKDHFTKDFGIQMPDELIENLLVQIEKTGPQTKEKGRSAKKRKELKNDLYEKVDYHKNTKKMKYDEIHKKLLEDFNDDEEMIDLIQNIKPESLSENFRRWKKKQQK